MSSIVAWEPGTTIKLCNVPWTDDYRDIVQFSTVDAQQTYFNTVPGPVLQVARLTYARFGAPVKLDIPFNEGLSYNYIVVLNSAPNDTIRAFYYFVQGVEYSAPDTTIFHLQLDVWQTFYMYVNLGWCFVERGHLGIANTNQTSNHGRDYLTVAEGLDIGDEYALLPGEATDTSTQPMSSVIIASSVLFSSPGTGDNPIITLTGGDMPEGFVSGFRYYLFEQVIDAQHVLSWLSDKPWIGQGITSIMTFPSDLTPPGTASEDVPGLGPVTYLTGGAMSIPATDPLAQDWSSRVMAWVGTRYSMLNKFLVSPYTMMEATTYTGSPMILKPEILDPTLNGVVFNLVYAFTGDSPRLTYVPAFYNSTSRPANANPWISGESFDMQDSVSNFPTSAVTVSAYLSYMTSNRNSITAQFQSADWSQQKALTGAQLSYNQASAGMNLAGTLTGISNQAANQQTSTANNFADINTAFTAIGDIGKGLAGGTPASAAGGLLSAGTAALATTMQNAQRTASTGIATSAATQSTAASVANAGYMRDSNNAYAKFAANGDYQNTVNVLNAKLQDARMMQPTVSGQQGGDHLVLRTLGGATIAVRIKTLSQNVVHMIGDYWLRYGYGINRFMPLVTSARGLNVMSKFTYWKVRELYMTGTYIPEQYRQSIRGIFEKGVTVWSDPSYIGVTDISDNQPLAGVSY